MSLFRSSSWVCVISLASSFIAGCEHHGSRFTAQSQQTMIADTTEYSGGRTRPSQEGLGQPEGIGRAHGHYYYIRNGQGTILTSRQRFVEGATYDVGGRIMLADGSLVRLIEGDMVTFGGDRMPMPPGTRLPTR